MAEEIEYQDFWGWGELGTLSEPVSIVDPGGEMGYWDPDPLPQLETVMPDYGEPFYDYGRPYLPAPSDEVTLSGGQLMSGSAGFPVWEPESYTSDAEPTLWDQVGDIWGSPEIKPLRDSLLNKYVLKPDTEIVNTAGRTETHVNPQATPPRGSVPVGTIPQQTVFFPWQQPGDIGDAPQAGPGLGISTSGLLIGGLVLFLLTR